MIKESALAGLRILELCDEAGEYCGKLLADMGADVIKVEPPGGERTRTLGPFLGDIPHPERSLYFWHYNTSKRAITLDLTSPADREIFFRLAATADAIVETRGPEALESLGLSFERLRKHNPGLVFVSMSPFGETGPYRHHLTCDLVAQARGGLVVPNGEPDREPLPIPGSQAYHVASVTAAQSLLAALFHRNQHGHGQRIELSVHEAVAFVEEKAALRHIYPHLPTRRGGSAGEVFRVVPCKDGYADITILDPWEPLAEWMVSEGADEELGDPRWRNRSDRRENASHLFDLMGRWCLRHTRDELIAKARRLRQTFAPVHNTRELMHDPQLRARGFFLQVEHPELGRSFDYPGAPYKFAEQPWRISRRPPLLGEQTAEVLAELGRAAARAGQAEPGPSGPEERGPLHGVRVIDFSWITAGPMGTRVLADLGAEVIKIEPVTGDRVRDRDLADRRPGINRGGHFNNMNRGKLGITLDMSQADGRRLAAQLLRLADVTINNFRAGVMDRWGLGYERLRELRPDIIMVEMPGFGGTGPLHELPAFGPTLQSMAGFTTLTAYRGGGPLGLAFAYADVMVGMTSALAVLLALVARQRTGKGQHVDLSHYEGNVALLETVVLDLSANGRARSGSGARADHLGGAPHGVYPCAGEDRWCAVAVFTDQQWSSLARVLGYPAWTGDERFSTVQVRQLNADLLDASLAQETRQWERYELQDRLQAAGVPAGVVQDGEDLVERDPQLRERGFYVTTDHPEIGAFLVQGPPARFSHTPARVRHGAPILGQHNDDVYGDLLGLSQAEMAEYRRRGIIEFTPESGSRVARPAFLEGLAQA